MMINNDAIVPAHLERLMASHRADPHNVELYADCIATALECTAFDVVISLAQAQLQRGGDEVRARFDLVNGLIGQREYVAALLQLHQLPIDMQASSQVLYNMGLCHFCLRQYAQARVPLEACYAQSERSAGLLRLLISTLHHLGLVADAIQIAADAAPLAAFDGVLAGVLAMLHLDAGNSSVADRWARTALQLHPKSIEGRVVQATLLTARLEHDSARRILEEVVAEVPTAGRAWLGLGILALINQDLSLAKFHLQRSLESMPQHIDLWHVLAWIHVTSGELPAAQQAFEEALALDRNFAETHGGLAVVAALRGERTRARSLMEVAVRLDDKCFAAAFAELVLQTQVGDAVQAKSLILDTVAGLPQRDGSALPQRLPHVSRSRLH